MHGLQKIEREEVKAARVWVFRRGLCPLFRLYS